MLTHHFIEEKVFYASPMLMMALQAFIFLFLNKFFENQMHKWGFTMSEG